MQAAARTLWMCVSYEGMETNAILCVHSFHFSSLMFMCLWRSVSLTWISFIYLCDCDIYLLYRWPWARWRILCDRNKKCRLFDGIFISVARIKWFDKFFLQIHFYLFLGENISNEFRYSFAYFIRKDTIMFMLNHQTEPNITWFLLRYDCLPKNNLSMNLSIIADNHKRNEKFNILVFGASGGIYFLFFFF